MVSQVTIQGVVNYHLRKLRQEREKKKKRKRNANRKRLKLKLYKNQYDISLPEDASNSKFWGDSLRYGETVIDMNNTEDSTDESSEDEISEEVKNVKEVTGDASVNDIISAIEKIKIARENDNSAQGLVSKNTDFRQAREEKFLFDSGAQVYLMGETIAGHMFFPGLVQMNH